MVRVGGPTIGGFEVQVHDVLRVQELQPPRHIQRDLPAEAWPPLAVRIAFPAACTTHSWLQMQVRKGDQGKCLKSAMASPAEKRL